MEFLTPIAERYRTDIIQSIDDLKLEKKQKLKDMGSMHAKPQGKDGAVVPRALPSSSRRSSSGRS